MHRAIDVTLIAFPDGSAVWLKAPTPDDIRAANDAWRNSLSADDRALHESLNTLGGCIRLRMPESKARWVLTENPQ